MGCGKYKVQFCCSVSKKTMLVISSVEEVILRLLRSGKINNQELDAIFNCSNCFGVIGYHSKLYRCEACSTISCETCRLQWQARRREGVSSCYFCKVKIKQLKVFYAISIRLYLKRNIC